MAVTTFKAEREDRGPHRTPKYHKMWLDGHEISHFVRRFEIIEGIDETPTVKLEIVAYATITEIEPEQDA